LINSTYRLSLCDDGGGADVLKEISVRIPTGRRKRKFSFAVLVRNITWSGATPDGASTRLTLPYVAEFRKEGQVVDQYRFNVREQQAVGMAQGLEYDFQDCAIPGVTMTGSEDEADAGSVERWIGVSRDVSPGGVCIPIRSEYGDGTNLLKEIREINLSLWDVTVDADQFALRPESRFLPNAMAGSYGAVVSAIVVLSDP